MSLNIRVLHVEKDLSKILEAGNYLAPILFHTKAMMKNVVAVSTIAAPDAILK
jgi:hypothetical protein